MTSFCVSELEAIKNLPGYQAILRTVLKSQIKQLVEQLSAHAGEEAILLSASLDDGTLSHVGSKSGEIFINTHGQVREQFLGFCMRTCKGQAEMENSSSSQAEFQVTSVKENIPAQSKEEQGQLTYEQGHSQDGHGFDIVMEKCREKIQEFSEIDTSLASTFDTDKDVGTEDNLEIHGEDSDETLMVIKQEPDSDEFEDDASEDVPDESFGAMGDVEPSAVAVCKNGKNSWVDPDTEDDVPKKRFKSASAEDVSKLRAQNTEKAATDKQTKWAVKIFQEWMLDMGLATNEFETFAVADLDVLLQRFYASVRTKDGKEYSKQALIGMRAALNRHLTTPPFSRTLNLMNDREFTASNQVFSGLVKDLKREVNIEHEEAPGTSKIHNEKRYSCKVCRYATKCSGNLSRHNRVVHQKLKVKCDECPRTFATQYLLNMHKTIIHEGSKLVCEVCNKQFNSKHTLRRHRHIVHMGETKYLCTTCGKTFWERQHYLGHISTHVDTKPFNCEICGKGFSYKTNYSRHIKSSHQPKKSKTEHICDICGSSFRTKCMLDDHLKGKHGPKQFVCECGKAFSWRMSLIRHRKSCKAIT